MVAKTDIRQATRECHLLEALIEMEAKADSLQATRERHLLEAVVEIDANSDAMQAARQLDCRQLGQCEVPDTLPDLPLSRLKLSFTQH